MRLNLSWSEMAPAELFCDERPELKRQQPFKKRAVTSQTNSQRFGRGLTCVVQLILEPFPLVSERLREAFHDLGDEFVTIGDCSPRVVHEAALHLGPSHAVSGRRIGRE